MENKEKLPGMEEKPGKPAKSGGKRRGFRKPKEGKTMPTKGGNDYSFWNEYPELMDIATRFPWMHIAGTPLKGQGVNCTLPNVAVQHYFSVPGKSGSATDPLNLSFRQLYLDMHRKYRGIGTYQAPDIAIAMICIESVLQIIVEMERIYGILRGYPIKSRIEPEGLLKAMGYGQTFIDSVKTNLADFRYSINRLIQLAKRLPLPQGMNFFRNHVALNAFTYRDSNDERSGILVFIFDNYYKWQTVGDPEVINNASTAVSTSFARSTFTSYQALVALVETELTALLSDSDVLRITSDFIACYGENNMQVLVELPENYSVVAQYSETILHKWHNSERLGEAVEGTAIGYIASGSSTQLGSMKFAVYQLNDLVLSLPEIYRTSGSEGWQQVQLSPALYAVGDVNNPHYQSRNCATGHINDSWMADPSKEFVCESVLWKRILGMLRTTGGADCANDILCGTEILRDLVISQVSNANVYNSAVYEDTLAAACSNNFTEGISHFDWHPYLFDIDVGSGEVTKIEGDTDNVTVVSTDTIRKILDAANLSAFKVNISASGNNKE